ncbi:hypothetical protein Tco_0436794 [Tanacetum coccineum]
MILNILKTGNKERKYTTSITKIKAARHKLEGIEDMIPRLWNPVKVAYDNDAALGILVRRVDQKEYTFKEGDFPRLHVNDIKYMILLHVQDKLSNLPNNDIVDLFSDGTLKSVCKILHERLQNFVLGYNKDMPKRKLTDKGQTRTRTMVINIDNLLLERRIMQSLKGLVGGRNIEMD